MVHSLELFSGAFLIGSYTCHPVIGVVGICILYRYLIGILDAELFFGAFAGGAVSAGFVKTFYWKRRGGLPLKSILKSSSIAIFAYYVVPYIIHPYVVVAEYDDMFDPTPIAIILASVFIDFDVFMASLMSCIYYVLAFHMLPDTPQRFILVLGGGIIVILLNIFKSMRESIRGNTIVDE